MEAVETIREDLNIILTEVANTLHLENYEVNINTEANYGDGFVAQFYTGEVRNKDTGETTLVAIKKAPNVEFEYYDVFKNEELFYGTALPVLDGLQKEAEVLKPFDNVPTYFCAGMEKRKEFIAMENLKPLGYVMFDKKEYLNEEHLEMIFKTYGKFHALSYVLRNKNLEQYHKITNEFVDITEVLVKFLEKAMLASVSAAVKALDLETDEAIYEEIKDFGENAVHTFKKASTYNGRHSCLIHGDCWSNNMFFKYSESGKLLDIKLIDFQLCKDSTPIHDLSYFFYSGASKKDFDNLDNYLQLYYNSFSKFALELGAIIPEEIFSFEVLKSEWKENALFGVLFGIYLWQVKLIPKEDITNMMDPEKGQPSIAEATKTWEALMEAIHKTDMYRDRTTAILRHAFEYGVLNKNTIVRENKE